MSIVPLARAKERFITTHWTLVLAAAQSRAPGAEAALEQLCRTYRPPLYAFLRRSGYELHQADDLVQEFFLQLLQNQTLAKADPERGRLRTFLLSALENFLANKRDYHRAAKREGSYEVVAVEALEPGEIDALPEFRDERSPRALYEARWALSAVDAALARLRGEAVASGKEARFDFLKPYLMGDTGDQLYGETAASFEMTPGALKTTVSRLRAHFRALLRQEVARTVAGPDDVEDELRHLRTVLSIPGLLTQAREAQM